MIQRWSIGIATATLCALSTLLCLPAHAQVPIYTMDNLTAGGLGNGPFTLGSSFTTTSSFVVTALGVFDDSQDGLLESHDVGLWASDGTLLASTTVGSGTVGTLVNQFRYTSITPIQLSSGVTYRIGAFWTPSVDNVLFPDASTNFGTASGIVYNNPQYGSSNSLSDPTTGFSGGSGYFGANILVLPGSATAPEPGSLAFLGMAALPIVGMVRRRKA